MATAKRWADTPEGYGIVSRTLHWGMALLFLWQFTGAALRVVADDTAIEGLFWRTHYSVGFTLWLLVLMRGAWGLSNMRNRPPHAGPPLERKAATFGQVLLYVLMTLAPTLAILRAVGSGRGLTVYGLQLVAPGGTPNPALVAPANAAHGFLGWTLLVLAVGHAAIAIAHAAIRRDATLDRMVKGESRRPVNP